MVQSLAERELLAECEERSAKARERKAAKYAGVLLPGTLTMTVARRVAGEFRDTSGDAVVVPESARAFNAHYDRTERERAVVLALAQTVTVEDVVSEALGALLS
jgi:hypothetical protein